jgi:glutathione S-transferase
MKLYDGGKAPNPRRVRVFLAEKGIEVPRVAVDMAALGHKAPAIAALNPFLRLPVLELNDGTALSESVAICRYFEETHPEPPLFGTGALGKAHVASAFRHLHPAMQGWEVPQIAEWGEANKPKALEFLAILDDHLAGSHFVAGAEMSIADITGLVALDFMKPARIDLPEKLTHVRRWHAMLKARPSAAA